MTYEDALELAYQAIPDNHYPESGGTELEEAIAEAIMNAYMKGHRDEVADRVVRDIAAHIHKGP